MKHNLPITLALVGFFLITQFVGLIVVNDYIDHKRTIETKELEWKKLPYKLERPEVKNQSISFIPIMIAILVGTFLILWLAKLNKPIIWKVWFFITVLITLSLALSALMNSVVAFGLALVLTVLRFSKPNILTHNITEIFIYGGLAAIFVPTINLFAAFILLAIISAYDIFAVWKTKHMVKLAEFQASANVFSGLMIDYSLKSKKAKPLAAKKLLTKKSKKPGKPLHNIAVLGGGDLGFPLIFAGVVMKGLMLQESLLTGFLKTSIIPVTTAIALLVLLMKGEKNKFYPAMPFLSIGAIAGYLVVLLI